MREGSSGGRVCVEMGVARKPDPAERAEQVVQRRRKRTVCGHGAA